MHGFGEGKNDLERWRLREEEMEEEWSAGGENEGESQRLTASLSAPSKGLLNVFSDLSLAWAAQQISVSRSSSVHRHLQWVTFTQISHLCWFLFPFFQPVHRTFLYSKAWVLIENRNKRARLLGGLGDHKSPRKMSRVNSRVSQHACLFACFATVCLLLCSL